MKKYLVILLLSLLAVVGYTAADRITQTWELTLTEAGGPSVIHLRPPALTSDYNFTLPNSAGTSGHFLATDGSGNMSWSNTLTSATFANPTFTGTITTPLTNNRALVTNGSSQLAASGVTDTELGYLSGVTSAIQSQFASKAPTANPTFTGTITTPLTASRALVTGASNELAASTVTTTELNRLSGITSALVSADNSVVLTNKTISGASNTITNVSLSSGVTGTLPIGNGGTGQTTANAAFNALAPSQATKAGRLLYTDGANTSWPAFLIWDTVNTRLGIATTTPRQNLSIGGDLDIYAGAANTPSTANIRGSSGDLYINSKASRDLYFNLESGRDILMYAGGVKGQKIFSGGNINFGDQATPKMTWTESTPALKLNTGTPLEFGGATSGTAGIKAAAVTTNYNMTLPPAQSVGAQYLQNDGSGNLSWVTGGGGASTPAGANTQVQYNDSGAMAGAPGLIYDKTNLRVGINATSPDAQLTIGAPTSGSSTAPVGVRDIHIVNTDGANGGLTMDSYGTSNIISGRRAQGTSAAKTALVNTAIAVRLAGYGWDGTSAYGLGGAIDIKGAGTWTNASYPTNISFRTTATNSTSASERMVLDSNGLLAVGTTIMATRVTAAGVGETTTISDAGDKTSTIRVTSTGGSGGDGGAIEFGAGHGSFAQSYFAAIKGLLNDASSNTKGDLGFYTRNAAADSSLTQRMLITSDGNVGVGRIPGLAFDVNGVMRSVAGTIYLGNGITEAITGDATGHTLNFATNSTNRVAIDSSGNITATAIHNNATPPTNTTQTISSGTYTPSITDLVNLTSTSSPTGMYSRVGNVVTVSGKVTVDAISAATNTRFDISLPIASNLSGIEDCNGDISFSTSTDSGWAYADGTSDVCTLQWTATSLSAAERSFMFQYIVK